MSASASFLSTAIYKSKSNGFLYSVDDSYSFSVFNDFIIVDIQLKIRFNTEANN
ncbi:hypothetical protein HanRHA438_Chr11g0500621 [Helianthus annuus]|uniref:Uncharacterized protein n=1 Tax=Helianthus annuus TaxID=4232 RepID=A0A251T9E7_HELAN|nr:hypothetical protein HanXRQr2_Chr11g0487861 [Helianthus annuus]KAJ0501333.1 hypothetical protein HanHA300_Chr11g0399621 [Helianthus annuus]KAJ0509103.1 hypothetical protein HanIR_Chr11g0525041 [Helianthus annuus]KAJ0517242.1 hypothetical protein HanHA89_Chr11g0423141 [Helianthus annuus]KAJ0685250.1 hypothetical protein HanLR1_Chr11g0400571 [Helianthus annuus]